MFKKKNIQKSNVNIGKDDLDKSQNTNNDADKSDSDSNELQQKVVKKVKTAANQEIKEQKEEFKKLADNKIEQLNYTAKETIIGRIENNASIANQNEDDEYNKEKQALLKKKAAENKRIYANEAKYYKGKMKLTDFLEQNDDQTNSSKIRGMQGPQRESIVTKASCQFDYNPYLCKDFHDTGECTFGDSCLYIHDRGDYKSGWEQERDWEKEQKLKQKRMQEHVHYDSEEEQYRNEVSQIEIPRVCPICVAKLKTPIKTKCNHYFCQKCALNHQQKSTRCFQCQQNTDGIFNNAEKEILQMKMKKKEMFLKFNNILREKKKRLLSESSSSSSENDIDGNDHQDKNYNKEEDNKKIDGNDKDKKKNVPIGVKIVKFVEDNKKQ